MLVIPSPKSHDQLVMLPVDRSVNVTVCPTIAVVGSAVKSAIGGGIVGVNVGSGVNVGNGVNVGGGTVGGMGVAVGMNVAVGAWNRVII